MLSTARAAAAVAILGVIAAFSVGPASAQSTGLPDAGGFISTTPERAAPPSLELDPAPSAQQESPPTSRLSRLRESFGGIDRGRDTSDLSARERQLSRFGRDRGRPSLTAARERLPGGSRDTRAPGTVSNRLSSRVSGSRGASATGAAGSGARSPASLPANDHSPRDIDLPGRLDRSELGSSRRFRDRPAEREWGNEVNERTSRTYDNRTDRLQRQRDRRSDTRRSRVSRVEERRDRNRDERRSFRNRRYGEER